MYELKTNPLHVFYAISRYIALFIDIGVNHCQMKATRYPTIGKNDKKSSNTNFRKPYTKNIGQNYEMLGAILTERGWYRISGITNLLVPHRKNGQKSETESQDFENTLHVDFG